ncbi:hypothetical protein [Virgibacillus siamensis]|uniref:hypothetical protein n=1 Tax=Virgibacillus siamensis TaxID=480071 RepID=UPI000986E3CA|nr:hypothetical protein [Virgibacillus siamensis]
MKKTLYIHIGSAKTATSSIQESFYQNKEYLKDRGLLYPVSPTFPKMTAQHDISFSVVGKICGWLNKPEIHSSREPVEKLLNRIRKTDCEKVLISSETFFDVYKTIDELKLLKDAFDDFDVKVVIYLRRYDDYFISMAEHNERVASPHAPARINVPQILKRLSPYGPRLDKWALVFGVKNMIVRPFNKDVFNNGNIIDDLLNVIGIERTEDYKETSTVNESLSFQRYELLRRMRARLDNNQKRNYNQKARHKVIESLPDDLLNKGKGKDILNYKQRREVLDHFEEDCRYIKGKYWNSDSEFFAELNENSYDNEDVKLEQKDLLELIDYLCNEVDKKR